MNMFICIYADKGCAKVKRECKDKDFVGTCAYVKYFDYLTGKLK